jgi:hypothetical protein
MAALRILLGAILLWAFADKAFGLGFATPAAKCWVAGASPTAGYLGGFKGSLAGVFQLLAGIQRHPETVMMPKSTAVASNPSVKATSCWWMECPAAFARLSIVRLHLH